MNWRLDHPPVLDVSISRHMGLYAVSRLAARHGIRVKLRPGTPQGLSALVWLPGALARHDHTASGGSHSRMPGTFTLDPVSILRPTTLTRHGVGRHRGSLLGASGEQPALTGRAGTGRGTGRGETLRGETLRGEQAGRPATVWFAAKRPSGDSPARSTDELAANWRSTTSGWPAATGQAMAGQAAAGQAAGHEAGRAGGYQAGGYQAGGYQTSGLPGIPEQAVETTAGLPRRMPRTSAFPGSGAPDFGLPADLGGTPVPVPGAPSGGMAAYQGGPYREAAYQEQTPSRRRSPEAARSRLSGFQLGSREAVQAGPLASQAPRAGEENGR
jgi:hypothetical protein